jgi:hypothetical protein
MRRMSTKLVLLGFALALCGGPAAQAQENQPKKPMPLIVAFGSDSPERGTTRVGMWNTRKNAGAGQFAIDYGRPVWRKEYEDAARFDAMTKGKIYRLGSNFWTVLDTDIPLTMAGKQVPAGAWYLGLHRSEDGATWSLAFIDPAKVRAVHMDASEINKAPVEFKVPMTTEQSSEMKEKLTIDLLFKETNPKDVTLKISWGKLQLTAPIQVPVPAGS